MGRQAKKKMTYTLGYLHVSVYFFLSVLPWLVLGLGPIYESCPVQIAVIFLEKDISWMHIATI